MMRDSTGTKRRTFFQRGLALLAGGAALAGTSRLAGAAPGSDVLRGNRLTLFARIRPAAGHLHGTDGRIIASGDLLDAPDGERIGSFYTNCFCVPTPFGVQPSAPSTLEFHVLQLKDGTLFSMGTGGATPQQGLAIIGGTERFAGRSGACLQRTVEARGDVRELSITFSA